MGEEPGSSIATLHPPDEFCCPVSIELMVDPVLLVGSGHTYERKSIEAWLQQHNSDPVTGMVVESTTLVPNAALKKAIASWRAAHPNSSYASPSHLPTTPAQYDDVATPPRDAAAAAAARARAAKAASSPIDHAEEYSTSGTFEELRLTDSDVQHAASASTQPANGFELKHDTHASGQHSSRAEPSSWKAEPASTADQGAPEGAYAPRLSGREASIAAAAGGAEADASSLPGSTQNLSGRPASALTSSPHFRVTSSTKPASSPREHEQPLPAAASSTKPFIPSYLRQPRSTPQPPHGALIPSYVTPSSAPPSTAGSTAGGPTSSSPDPDELTPRTAGNPAALGLAAYPQLFAMEAPSKIAVVQDLLLRLDSASWSIEAFRRGSSYLVWQLRELALDPSCRRAMQESDAVPLLVRLTRDAGLPDTQAMAAGALRRLTHADADTAGAISSAGGLAALAELMRSPQPHCREAAAAALAAVGFAAWKVKLQIFEVLCGSTANGSGMADAGSYATSSAAGDTLADGRRCPLGAGQPQDGAVAGQDCSQQNPLAAVDQLLAKGSTNQLEATAFLLHMLMDRLPPQQAARVQLGGSSVAPALVAVLGGRSPAATYAAGEALVRLGQVPGNLQEVVATLTRALSLDTLASQAAVAHVLWQLGRSDSPTAANSAPPTANAAAVSAMRGTTAALGPALPRLLQAGRTAAAAAMAAGLVQLLTHEEAGGSGGGGGRRTSLQADWGSFGGTLDVESVRAALVEEADGTLVPALAELLQSPDESIALAAASSLANLSAFRGAATGSASNSGGGSFSEQLVGSPAGSHRRAAMRAVQGLFSSREQGEAEHASPRLGPGPRGAVAACPAAVLGLAHLLQAGGSAPAAAAVVALNNVVATEGERGAVRAHLRAAVQLDPTCARLLFCISWPELAHRYQNAARVVLQRLQRRDRAANPLQYAFFCAPLLPPPPRHPVPMPV